MKVWLGLILSLTPWGAGFGNVIAISAQTMRQCASYLDISQFRQCCLTPDNYDNIGKIYTDAEIDEMRRQDTRDCLNFPGGIPRLSDTGNLCVVWNLSDVDNLGASISLDAYAHDHGGIAYVDFCATPDCPNAAAKSRLMMKNIVGNVSMYVMRGAYVAARQECLARGGTLSIQPGEKHKNSFIQCTVEGDPGILTQAQCDAWQTVWPAGYVNNVSPGEFSEMAQVNGKTVRVRCTYTPVGMYYTARDLPGKCMDNMVENTDTGYCMCRYGYDGPKGESTCRMAPK